jgi:hypothetical protein
MGIKPRIFVSQGQRFGRGVVIDPEIRIKASTHPAGVRGARLRCDCGTVYEAMIYRLAHGGGQSCKCCLRDSARQRGSTPESIAKLTEINRRPENRERVRRQQTRHGLTGHPLFNVWLGMLDRCENPDSRQYHRAGGRGVTVCPAWHDVAVFIAWVEANLEPRPANGYFGRIDGSGDYAPGNVRWITPSRQAAGHPKRRGTYSSRFKGVSLYRKDGTWQAQITVNYRNRYLGRFPTEEAAASAYDDAAIAAWGRFARLTAGPATCRR